MADAKRVRHIVAVALLIALTAILLPIFIINLTLTIRSSMDKTVPASVFGLAPLAVETDSMKGIEEDSFAGGSLILVRMIGEEEKQQLEVGQIVTFRQQNDDGTYYFVTHRITELGEENGAIAYVVTRGDRNTIDDGATAITDVLGVCVASVPGLGSAVLFLQTPWGLLLCIGVPVVAYIVYDVVRIARRNRRLAAEQGAAMQQKDAEIARLRAMVGAGIEAEREAGGEQLAWGEEELFGDAAPMSEEAPDGEIAMVEEAPDGEIAPMSEEAPDGEIAMVEEAPDGEIAAMVEEAPDGEAAPMVEEAPDGEIAMVEEAPDGEQAVGEQPAEIAEQPVETAEQPAEIAEEAAEAAEEAAEIAEQPAEVAARPAQDKPAGGGQARRRRRGRKHR